MRRRGTPTVDYGEPNLLDLSKAGSLIPGYRRRQLPANHNINDRRLSRLFGTAERRDKLFGIRDAFAVGAKGTGYVGKGHVEELACFRAEFTVHVFLYVVLEG